MENGENSIEVGHNTGNDEKIFEVFTDAGPVLVHGQQRRPVEMSIPFVVHVTFLAGRSVVFVLASRRSKSSTN
jgi:hypothetical protein